MVVVVVVVVLVVVVVVVALLLCALVVFGTTGDRSFGTVGISAKEVTPFCLARVRIPYCSQMWTGRGNVE